MIFKYFLVPLCVSNEFKMLINEQAWIKYKYIFKSEMQIILQVSNK